AAIHDLRLTIKHLRYTLEALLPALPTEFRDDFLPQMRHLQSLAGEHQDAIVVQVAARELSRKWKKHRPRPACRQVGLSDANPRAIRSALQQGVAKTQERTAELLTEMCDLWPGFSGASFRHAALELLDSTSGASASTRAQRATDIPADH
ncbi:MAG: CHAD domain-containing protein, partial [Planctomycetes bacterium]|nr:CHAD domain-containing protein [Planctomycetota bacterium]